LFPVLRATKDCRIVTVTSAFHWFASFDLDRAHTENGYNRVWSYAFSKLCNLLFAFELARRLRKVGLSTKSTAAHPGLTKTQLAAHSPLTRFFTACVGQSAKAGAIPQLHAAIHPDAESGALYGPALGLWGGARRDLASPAAENLEHATQLWQRSEELSGIRFPIGDDAAA
jgi:NAD(P)-dependent dehydrogenase (short-subunit alcohol dehydrogenase family)